MAEIDIRLSREQRRALDYLASSDRVTKRVVFGGQAGGGKSFLICLWQIRQRIMYAGTRGYIARETLKDIKNSVLITFFDVANLLCLEKGVHYKYNDYKSHIEFYNGSRINLLEVKYKPSDPDFNDLGSTEYTDGAVEEGIGIHQRAAEFLLSRTRYKHPEYNLYPKQLITCNPGAGWIKDTVVVPSIQGLDTGLNKFVRATLESNPNKEFSVMYKETLEGLSNEYDKARLLHGDWFALPKTGGEFYKGFDQNKNTGKEVYDEDLPLHFAFDENVNPYITCNVWQLSGKKAWQIDEIHLRDPLNTLASLTKEINRRYQSHSGKAFIYGDATSRKEDSKIEKGYNFFTIIKNNLNFKNISLRIPGQNPSVSQRGDFLNKCFEDNYLGIDISVHEKCTNTIIDYGQVKEDMDGSKKKILVKNPETRVNYEPYGHSTDANDYFLLEVFKEEYNEYIRGNKPLSRVIQQRLKTNEF